MKGLVFAQEFFLEWGLPFLRKEFPGLADRVAAGRVRGSDVLGADDEISRDHNWGPQFWLFLSAADFAAHGARVSEVMNAAAPNPWNGYRLAGAGDRSVLVENIPQWFEEFFGLTQPPREELDWLPSTKESDLYFLRHGTVWVDATGELSAWRNALHKYPPGILNARLAEECFRIWHHGEYNFVQRMAKRRDPLAMAMCLGEFVNGVMRIIFLLRGDFAPYWKWLAFEFRKMPEAALYAPLLDELAGSRDVDQQVILIKELCGRVHKQLVASGAVTVAFPRF